MPNNIDDGVNSILKNRIDNVVLNLKESCPDYDIFYSSIKKGSKISAYQFIACSIIDIDNISNTTMRNVVGSYLSVSDDSNINPVDISNSIYNNINQRIKSRIGHSSLKEAIEDDANLDKVVSIIGMAFKIALNEVVYDRYSSLLSKLKADNQGWDSVYSSMRVASNKNEVYSIGYKEMVACVINSMNEEGDSVVSYVKKKLSQATNHFNIYDLDPASLVQFNSSVLSKIGKEVISEDPETPIQDMFNKQVIIDVCKYIANSINDMIKDKQIKGMILSRYGAVSDILTSDDTAQAFDSGEIVVQYDELVGVMNTFFGNYGQGLRNRESIINKVNDLIEYNIDPNDEYRICTMKFKSSNGKITALYDGSIIDILPLVDGDTRVSYKEISSNGSIDIKTDRYAYIASRGIEGEAEIAITYNGMGDVIGYFLSGVGSAVSGKYLAEVVGDSNGYELKGLGEVSGKGRKGRGTNKPGYTAYDRDQLNPVVGDGGGISDNSNNESRKSSDDFTYSNDVFDGNTLMVKGAAQSDKKYEIVNTGIEFINLSDIGIRQGKRFTDPYRLDMLMKYFEIPYDADDAEKLLVGKFLSDDKYAKIRLKLLSNNDMYNSEKDKETKVSRPSVLNAILENKADLIDAFGLPIVNSVMELISTPRDGGKLSSPRAINDIDIYISSIISSFRFGSMSMLGKAVYDYKQSKMKGTETAIGSKLSTLSEVADIYRRKLAVDIKDLYNISDDDIASYDSSALRTFFNSDILKDIRSDLISDGFIYFTNQDGISEITGSSNISKIVESLIGSDKVHALKTREDVRSAIKDGIVEISNIVQGNIKEVVIASNNISKIVGAIKDSIGGSMISELEIDEVLYFIIKFMSNNILCNIPNRLKAMAAKNNIQIPITQSKVVYTGKRSGISIGNMTYVAYIKDNGRPIQKTKIIKTASKADKKIDIYSPQVATIIENTTRRINNYLSKEGKPITDRLAIIAKVREILIDVIQGKTTFTEWLNGGDDGRRSRLKILDTRKDSGKSNTNMRSIRTPSGNLITATGPSGVADKRASDAAGSKKQTISTDDLKARLGIMESNTIGIMLTLLEDVSITDEERAAIDDYIKNSSYTDEVSKDSLFYSPTSDDGSIDKDAWAAFVKQTTGEDIPDDIQAPKNLSREGALTKIHANNDRREATEIERQKIRVEITKALNDRRKVLDTLVKANRMPASTATLAMKHAIKNIPGMNEKLEKFFNDKTTLGWDSDDTIRKFISFGDPKNRDRFYVRYAGARLVEE